MTDLSSIPNLQQRQIMLCFAYLAYSGELITTPNPMPQILDLINTAMPQLPPINSPNDTWAVVWGPSTYTVPGALYQENMAFVAKNQTTPGQIVIAIRGTNSISDVDWLLDDLDVRDMMPWIPPGTLTPVGNISESTSIALQSILALQATVAGSSGSSTILEFLTSQANTPLNVCVTGHSLGGCLTTTLALYLKERQSLWDTSGQSLVSCISFAGPTAGDQNFAAYSDAKFVGGPYPPGWDTTLGNTCDCVRCSLDVASLVWDSNNVDTNSPNLITLYNPQITFSGFEWDAVKMLALPCIANFLVAQNYRQIEYSQATLTGAFNGDPPPSDSSLTQLFEAYVTQAVWQHSSSYPTLLSVPQLIPPRVIVRN
jgi:hypothetical protein